MQTPNTDLTMASPAAVGEICWQALGHQGGDHFPFSAMTRTGQLENSTEMLMPLDTGKHRKHPSKSADDSMGKAVPPRQNTPSTMVI